MGRGQTRLKHAKTVAMDCDQLPRPQNGKEGVDGSSPSEGFLKHPAKTLLLFAGETTGDGRDVHRTSTAQRDGAGSSRGNAVLERLSGLPSRRPPNVHAPSSVPRCCTSALHRREGALPC